MVAGSLVAAMLTAELMNSRPEEPAANAAPAGSGMTAVTAGAADKPPERRPTLTELLGHLRTEMSRKGITYADVGNRAGYSAETVRAPLSGRRTVRTKTVAAAGSLIAGPTGTTLTPPARPTGITDPDHIMVTSVSPTGPLRSTRTVGLGTPGQRWMVTGDHNVVNVSQPLSAWRSAPPDPTLATTVPQFHAKLVELHVWDGAPSLRALAGRSRWLSRSTVSDGVDMVFDTTWTMQWWTCAPARRDAFRLGFENRWWNAVVARCMS